MTTNQESKYCTNCSHHHIFFLAEDGKTILDTCQILNCSCKEFRESPFKDKIFAKTPWYNKDISKKELFENPNWNIYIEQLKHKIDIVKFELDNISFTRNFENLRFVLFYWLLFDAGEDKVMRNCIKYMMKNINSLTDSETIRRAKQDAVEKNPVKYGPTEDALITEKIEKEYQYYTHFAEQS